jgi:hypothetical protein
VFTVLEQITPVLFAHPEAETQVHNWKKRYGRDPSFAISATKYMTYIIPHKGIINK